MRKNEAGFLRRTGFQKMAVCTAVIGIGFVVTLFLGSACLEAQLTSTNQPPADTQQSQPPAQAVSHGQQLGLRPLVIAHRGASGYLPEHTQEATVLAHAMGADFIEQDVVLTKDGTAVVVHDLTLDDVTDIAERFPERARPDGHFYVIDFDWSELQTLRVHERTTPTRPWKDQNRRFPASQGHFRLMSLAEQLELVQGLNQTTGRKTGIYLELKDPQRHREAGYDLAGTVLQVLKSAGYESADDPVYLQCFDFSEVKRLRTEFETELPVVQLCSECPTREQLVEYSKYADGVGVKITHIIEEIDADSVAAISDVVATAREHALQVHVGTVRSDALPTGCSDADLLLTWLCREAGVDGVLTDHPDVVVSWRARNTDVIERSGPFHLLNKSGSRGDAARRLPAE